MYAVFVIDLFSISMCLLLFIPNTIELLAIDSKWIFVYVLLLRHCMHFSWNRNRKTEVNIKCLIFITSCSVHHICKEYLHNYAYDLKHSKSIRWERVLKMYFVVYLSTATICVSFDIEKWFYWVLVDYFVIILHICFSFVSKANQSVYTLSSPITLHISKNSLPQNSSTQKHHFDHTFILPT